VIARQPQGKQMFTKIPIANRGDHRRAALAAAKPECLARTACAGDLTAAR
jgi:hypothetical protein